MIDTIVLSIPADKFQISNHNRFNPSTVGFFHSPYMKMGGKGFIKAVQNPSKVEMRKGFYRPRLTVFKAVRKGEYDISLKIELSLPKLFFGNNFDELEDVNFLRIVRLLHKALYEMDVQVEFEDLEKASVSAIHYSKNIHLKNYTTCSMILSELQKADLSSRIDIGSEKFRNEGQALHFHTNNRDIVFYDKIKDLQQAKISGKRAIEKDNEMQLGLFDEVEKINALQVFRMETRFGNRKEIQKILDRIEVKCDLNFKSLFNQSISKKVLQYYWSEIQDATTVLSFKTQKVFELAESIKANNKDLKPKKTLELLGFLVLGKEGGTRRLRHFLGYYGSTNSNRKWYAIKKEMKNLNYDKSGNYQAMNEIKNDLITFESTKFSNIRNANRF